MGLKPPVDRLYGVEVRSLGIHHSLYGLCAGGRDASVNQCFQGFRRCHVIVEQFIEFSDERPLCVNDTGEVFADRTHVFFVC